MANDRLFIRCLGCNHYFMVAKYYPSTGPVLYDSDGSLLREWMEKHLAECHDCQTAALPNSLFCFMTEEDERKRESGYWDKRG